MGLPWASGVPCTPSRGVWRWQGTGGIGAGRGTWQGTGHRAGTGAQGSVAAGRQACRYPGGVPPPPPDLTGR